MTGAILELALVVLLIFVLLNFVLPSLGAGALGRWGAGQPAVSAEHVATGGDRRGGHRAPGMLEDRSELLGLLTGYRRLGVMIREVRSRDLPGLLKQEREIRWRLVEHASSSDRSPDGERWVRAHLDRLPAR